MYIKVGASTGVRGRSSSDMFGKIILALSVLAWASAQIPNLGFCPEYIPMANFNRQRFMGVWYEAERYFQLTEVVSRCVMTNYTRGSDGKFRVINEVTNRFTGIKRILEGEIKPAASKAEEGRLTVKYTTVPLTPETKYSVLETDYDSYAVLWSCQGIGPVHAQNAWVMTRERIPSGKVLQKAYGVLDKYKISKTFFVKTDQTECAYLDTPPEEPEEAKNPDTEKRKRRPQSTDPNKRSAGVLNDADAEIKEKEEAGAGITGEKALSDIPKIIAEEPAKLEQLSVPERILKIAEVIQKEGIIDVQEESLVQNTSEKKSEHPKKTEATA
ncbi:apolipoprotein D [Monomorium pharaonis]|uniref:apolipoprotein D n=1 Tax=Monomorium pharaonis TaxID=307658 RepID=UPI00102E1FDF|nr:apolipoprotein D [Monomorium pharaonis]